VELGAGGVRGAGQALESLWRDLLGAAIAKAAASQRLLRSPPGTPGAGRGDPARDGRRGDRLISTGPMAESARSGGAWPGPLPAPPARQPCWSGAWPPTAAPPASDAWTHWSTPGSAASAWRWPEPDSSDGLAAAVAAIGPQAAVAMPSSTAVPCRWPPAWIGLCQAEAWVSGEVKNFELILGLDAAGARPFCSKPCLGPADRPAFCAA